MEQKPGLDGLVEHLDTLRGDTVASDALRQARDRRVVWLVFFTATDRQGLNTYTGPVGYAFDDHAEARQFADHVSDLYGYDDVVMVVDHTHTYDSAIQALVDAVGPSDYDPDATVLDDGTLQFR